MYGGRQLIRTVPILGAFWLAYVDWRNDLDFMLGAPAIALLIPAVLYYVFAFPATRAVELAETPSHRAQRVLIERVMPALDVAGVVSVTMFAVVMISEGFTYHVYPDANPLLAQLSVQLFCVVCAFWRAKP